MSNPKPFGKLIRELRTEAGITLSQVADALDVSIVYVSDVERGKRPPFVPAKIRALANLLRESTTALLERAARERSSFEFDVSRAGPAQIEALACLARSTYTEAEWNKIAEAIKEVTESDD